MSRLKLQGNSSGTGTITVTAAETSGSHAVTMPEESGALVTSESGSAFVPGMVMGFGMISPPAGWLECNGAAVSRETYSDLFSAIETTWGSGNGSDTFNLPDLRGEFIRGYDNSRGIDTGRTFASAQGDAIRDIPGTWRDAYDHGAPSTGAIVEILSNSPTGDTAAPQSGGKNYEFDASNVLPTANENRPRNIAVLYCIKY